MIEIKVNDEIRDVQSTLFMGLTLWQAVFCGIGLFLGGGAGLIIYLFTPLPVVVISYVSIFTVVPFGFLAFFTWHELNAWQFVKVYFASNFTPKWRTYHNENRQYMRHLKYQETMKKIEKKEKKTLKKGNKKNGNKDTEKSCA